LPSAVKWTLLQTLCRKQPFEAIEARVPDAMRSWGVRNSSVQRTRGIVCL
jgi:hypothetical protein